MLYQQIKDPQILAWSIAPLPKDQIMPEINPPQPQIMPPNLSQFQTSPFDPIVVAEKWLQRLQNVNNPQQSTQNAVQPQLPVKPQVQQTPSGTMTQKQPQTPLKTQLKPQQATQNQQSQPQEQAPTPTLSQNAQKASEIIFQQIKKRADEWKDLLPEERQQIIERIAQSRWLQWEEQLMYSSIDDRMQQSWYGNIDTMSWLAESNMRSLEKYKTMDSDQMVQLIENWMLKAWQEIEIQGMQNYQEALAKIKAKKASKNANNIINADWAKKENSVPVLKTRDTLDALWLGKNLPESTMEQVRSLKSDEVLTWLSWEIWWLDEEIFLLQWELKNLEKSITAEFPTSIEKSALRAIMYDRKLPMNDELETKLWLRQAKVMDYERVKSEKQEQMKMKLQQQQQTMNFLNADNGMALFATSQAELQAMEDNGSIPKWYAWLYGNMMEQMTTNTLSAYWMVSKEDQEYIQSMIQSWKTPQEAIAVLQSNGRFSPQSANAFGFMSLWNWKVAVTNKITWGIEIVSEKQAQDNSNWLGISIPVQKAGLDFIRQKTWMVWEYWGQCWVFLNEYLKSVWMIDITVGNTIEQKKAKINRTTEEWPIDWAIVVMAASGDSVEFWHTGLVYRWPNWQWRILDSNYWSDKKIQDRAFDPNDKTIRWYQDPNITMNMTTPSSFERADVVVFNKLTPSDRNKKQNDPTYRLFEATKWKVFSDKNAKIEDIMYLSAWWWAMWDAARQSLAKVKQAYIQVSDVWRKVQELTTWPIRWRIRNANEWDTDAQVLSAQIIASIPNVARWVYWEVWVLTDADVELYKKTLPSLKSTEAINKALTSMTIRAMANSYKSRLQTEAWAWIDVSLFDGDYWFLIQESDKIIQSLWGETTQSPTEPAKGTAKLQNIINQLNGL